MPYISFKTNHKLTLRQENTIKSKSGELISLIPGKTEKALMIHMEDDQIMYFKGEETPCMMIEINLYKSAEFDDKKKLTEAMKERKIFEKLREKAWEKFQKEELQKEQKEVDELVSYTYSNSTERI